MRTLSAFVFVASSFALAAACGSSTPAANNPATSSSASASATAESSASTASVAPVDPPAGVIAGGACTYAHQSGTCSILVGGNFTFKGTVDGKNVTLGGNTLGPSDKTPAPGTSIPCTIDFITGGTCTPCTFSIGSCGEAAWEAFRAHK
jgi:hypothetical protein